MKFGGSRWRLGVFFKVGCESGVCRIPWTTVDTLLYTLGMSYSSSSKAYYTCRSTNSNACETSELTCGLSSAQIHSSLWAIRGMSNPNKGVVIEKNDDNKTNGHRKTDRVAR